MPKKITYDDFVNRSNLIHKRKYDYSKSNLSGGVHVPVEIICPIHGSFFQSPAEHMRGCKCPKCAYIEVHNKQRKTNETFIKEIEKIYGDKYDFSKVNYTGAKNKVCVICPIHGEFYIRPNDLLNGHGCPACAGTKPLTTDSFKERAIKMFGNKYEYDNVNYKNLGTHVMVTCKKHGDFPITPRNFFNGYGCPKCNQSHLEKSVECFLEKAGVDYYYQYKPQWAGSFKYDFYIPLYNTIIECQGRQHFGVIDYFKGEEGYKYLKSNDILKNKLCKKNGVKIVYLLYNANVNIPEDLTVIYNSENTFFNIETLWGYITKTDEINETILRDLIKEELLKRIKK